jgi:hypothetical protein
LTASPSRTEQGIDGSELLRESVFQTPGLACPPIREGIPFQRKYIAVQELRYGGGVV